MAFRLFQSAREHPLPPTLASHRLATTACRGGGGSATFVSIIPVQWYVVRQFALRRPPTSSQGLVGIRSHQRSVGTLLGPDTGLNHCHYESNRSCGGTSEELYHWHKLVSCPSEANDPTSLVSETAATGLGRL
ncbi:hypothetical protein J6590_065043 [Homalodisca vitripennis]|nr:hypothetical protein J6590_065043 [Homalodisca vitripennis]